LSGNPFRSKIPWQDVHVFWGDERCVPTNHPESLYGMVWELMLSSVPIPPENVHRMRGEAKNPSDAASEYEEMLRGFFRLKIHEKPRFDLILLGMGADGHTASLFPGTEALEEKRRLVVANYVPALKVNRLTLTLPVLNNAAMVMFLVAGESKASSLRSVLHDTREEKRLPAGMIDPQNGRVLWLIDWAAADLLE
jgi:6-phosphogluconolactonase